MRAVEVGEDERHSHAREHVAEPARRLARPRVQVEEAALAHRAVKPAQPPVHAVEHDLPGIHQVLGRAERLRVARRVDQRQVPGVQLVPAVPDPALFQQLRHQRHDMGDDLVAVGRHLRRAVIHPAHPLVAERDEALVAEVSRHAVAQLHQAVVDVVQLRAVLREPLPFRLLRPVTHVAVQVLRVGRQPGQVHRHPFHRQPRGGGQLRVARRERRFLRQPVGDHRVEGGDVRFPQPHRVRAGLRLQPGAVRVGEQAAFHRHVMPLRHRP